jgi:hypothetical protein
LASTIARLLTQLRWDNLTSNLSTLLARTVELEKGYKYEVEVLWTGNVGNITSLTLTRNLRIGDKLFIQSNDAARWTSMVSPIKSITPGQTLHFLSGPSSGGVITSTAIGATPNIINTVGFTSGFGIASINALRVVKN